MPLITEDVTDFKGIPPFPDNVPTAPLLRISLRKLIDGDAEELDRVWKACCDLGFFYLDLRMGDEKDGLDGDGLLDDAYNLFKVGEGLFELPLAEKQKHDHSAQNSYYGYAQSTHLSSLLTVSKLQRLWWCHNRRPRQ